MYSIIENIINLPENPESPILWGCVVVLVGSLGIIYYGFARLISKRKRKENK